MILQVSYGSTSPALSDNSKYPMFMRVIPSDSACNMAIIALLRRFKWKKVALIKKNDVLYSTVGWTTLCFTRDFKYILQDKLKGEPTNLFMGQEVDQMHSCILPFNSLTFRIVFFVCQNGFREETWMLMMKHNSFMATRISNPVWGYAPKR